MTTLRTSARPAKTRGLALLEILLGLAVLAFLILAGFRLYSNTNNSALTNEALTQVQTYASGIKNLHSGTSSYGTGTLVAAAINGGVAAQSSVNGNNLRNPWGGVTTITGINTFFRISMNNVPQDSCVRMVTSNLMTTGGIYAIRAGSNSGAVGTTATPAAPTTASATANNGSFVSTAAPTPNDAATACSAGSTNNMHFYVR